jgi:capsid protein
VAAGLGVTYEDLVGDYSLVNFSIARMGRLAHQENVKCWQYNMLIPLLCDRVFAGSMRRRCSIAMPGSRALPVGADWTVPPLPMIEPDKEGLAYSRLVRNGTMTYSEMIREQGGDPEAHWAEYAADQKKLDELKIKLDSDPRATSQAGLTQERAGVGANAPSGEKPTPEEKKRLLVAAFEAFIA